jgi:Uma2 family endonuclease
MGRYTITIEPGALTSAEEYARLPDEPGWRTELTDGRVVRMPQVNDHAHGWIIDNLSRRLSPYVHDRQLSRLTYSQEGYDISRPGAEGETVWAPDPGFVSIERLPIVREARRQGKYARLAPDLAVEVVSPSEGRTYVTEKVQRWLSAGTRLLWAIWPESQTVEVWQADEPMSVLRAPDRLDGLEVVPGFTMPAAELFEF